MSNGDTWVAVLDRLSELAFRYGPSFFALLFLLFLVRTASSEYQKVICRTNPPPKDGETSLYAGLLVSSWIAGIILVGVSVWFFLFMHQTKHTFEVVIVNLNPTAIISTEAGFTRRTFRNVAGGPALQDYSIVLVSDRPFRKGERYLLNYIPQLKDAGRGDPPEWDNVWLQIDSMDQGIPRFKIAGDPGKFQLVRMQ